jgi:hypothetical protein
MSDQYNPDLEIGTTGEGSALSQAGRAVGNGLSAIADGLISSIGAKNADGSSYDSSDVFETETAKFQKAMDDISAGAGAAVGADEMHVAEATKVLAEHAEEVKTKPADLGPTLSA